MTTELERIKILEEKISQVVEYIKRLVLDNEKLRSQIKQLKADKKSLEELARKAGKLDENLRNFEEEKKALKERIENIISQIDQIGL